MSLSYRRVTQANRLWFVVLLAMATGALASLYVLRVTEERTLLEREGKLRAAVDTAMGVVEQQFALAQKGLKTREEAQRAAFDVLRQLRYDGQEYFWVNDLEPRMLLHPMKPSLEGQPVGHMTDPSGRRLFEQMVQVARAPGGQGVVRYDWPKPGHERSGTVKELHHDRGGT